MAGATLLAVLFRVNLPVALLTTLYTNPFTILPLYVMAYELGGWVLGSGNAAPVAIHLPELQWNDWLLPLIHWMLSLGKAFAVGLPLLAISLAASGYLAVRLAWRGWVVWALHRRRMRRQRGSGNE